MSARGASLADRGDPPNQLPLPAPDEYADLDRVEPGETAPLWHLRGALFEDLGTWVRAASASGPMEIAGHDVADDDLEAIEHDLLALLAAVRASRVAVDDRHHADAGDAIGPAGAGGAR